MKYIIRFVVLAVVGLSMTGCGGSPILASKTVADAEMSGIFVPEYSAEAFFETTSYSLVGASAYAFSVDGSSLLISSDQTGVFNVYSLPLDGSAAMALTHSADNSTFAVSWFPDDERMLYTQDGGGDELNHILVREADGSTRDITPGKSLKASFISWNNDGNSFYVTTTERNGRTFDLYRYSTEDYSRELIYENPGLQVAAISSDGRWLALDEGRPFAATDIFVVDLESKDKEPVLITEHVGEITYRSYTFSPDGSELVFATNEHGEFSQPWTHNLASGEKAALIETDWGVGNVTFSASGRYRIASVNADARTEVTIINLESGETLSLPTLPQGAIENVQFSPDDSQVALILNADDSPSNIHVIDLATGETKQLTDALNPDIDQRHLVVSEVIRYKSFDGLEIPSILYRPHGASSDNPVPGLVLVHGGPGGQTRTGYQAMVQHLVNHGYAVLGANNRGSSGYGKTFFHLDDKRHGEEDLQDIVYGRAYLESLDWVDDSKIGIIGGSYGGFMVAAALAFEPQAFDVGIDIFGVTNWVRTLSNIPPWWESMRQALYDEMGDPAIDSERHRRISPLFHAENIVKPILVVQGANDPRVLQVESDELVAAIRANNVPVEYVVFPDEGHGFRKKANKIAASSAYVKFLDTYLKGDAQK